MNDLPDFSILLYKDKLTKFSLLGSRNPVTFLCDVVYTSGSVKSENAELIINNLKSDEEREQSLHAGCSYEFAKFYFVALSCSNVLA